MAILQYLSVALSMAVSVTAQSNDTNPHYPGIGCNHSISDFNASNVHSFDVGWPDHTSNQTNEIGGLPNLPNASWAVTADEYGNYTIWYDTAGQDYANDVKIGYDVCAIFIQNLRQNTLALGQNDPGDCSATLSPQCITNLTGTAEQSAQKWIAELSNQFPRQNTTVGVIQQVCDKMKMDIQLFGETNTWPEVCWEDFNIDPKNPGDEPMPMVHVWDLPLTDYNSTRLEESCQLYDGNQTFYRAFADDPPNIGTVSTDSYDNAVHDINIILTVHLTVANDQRQGSGPASADLTCLRPSNIARGSRSVSSLPAGTPYPAITQKKHLSAGAIAGIVIGAIAGLLLVAALCYFCWRRRKSRTLKNNQAEAKETISPHSEADGANLAEIGGKQREYEADGTSFAEMEGKEHKHETDGNEYVEMPGHDVKPVELPAHK